MTERNYLIRTLLFILFTVIAVVVINYSVDPYAIMGTQRVPGLNEYKVDINSRVRLMKKYNPLLSQHNTLVVGNSRVEIGINPAHHCFVDNDMVVYNLGLPGAHVRDQLAYAVNVINQQPVKTVLLSLDFTDFIFTRKRGRFEMKSLWDHEGQGFRYKADGDANPAYLRGLALDYYGALFSLDSLISSVRTVVLQGDFTSDRTDTGFNPSRDFAESVQVEGPSALFDQKMKDLRDHFSVPWYLIDDQGRLDPSFDELRHFLDLMVERQIAVYLFVNPFHEVYWELLRTRGVASLNQQWLQQIYKLVEKYPSDSVTLWDFSGDSPYIHESVPPSGVRTSALQWFWEPSHYRAALGDLMVETMLSERCGTNYVFGQKRY